MPWLVSTGQAAKAATATIAMVTVELRTESRGPITNAIVTVSTAMLKLVLADGAQTKYMANAYGPDLLQASCEGQ